MFPLAGDRFPTSASELSAALTNALADVFLFPDKNAVVKIEGAAWPALDRVTVNMTNAALRSAQPPARPVPQGALTPGVAVNQLAISGHPIRHEQSKLDLDFNAKGVRANFGRDASGKPMLVITAAAEGRVAVHVGKADLQAALLAAATAAAKPHGVSIADLQLNLVSDGPRSLAGELRVKAKKMVMSGVVLLRGKIAVDDQLVATLSNLACAGEGMIGGMAAAMVNTKLRSFDGKRIPLTTFSLSDVSLRDLTVSAGEVISVTAAFGT